jgi:stringent starvation protein B
MINWFKKLFFNFFKFSNKNNDFLAKKQETSMTSIRPYLLRAFYEWISDNAYTPLIVIDATVKGVIVPQEYVASNGQITLDIAEDAVDNLEITQTSISFEALFNDEMLTIFIPIRAVLAIYSLENEEGMSFVDQADEYNDQEQHLVAQKNPASKMKKNAQVGQEHKKESAQKSHLTIIK